MASFSSSIWSWAACLWPSWFAACCWSSISRSLAFIPFSIVILCLMLCSALDSFSGESSKPWSSINSSCFTTGLVTKTISFCLVFCFFSQWLDTGRCSSFSVLVTDSPHEGWRLRALEERISKSPSLNKTKTRAVHFRAVSPYRRVRGSLYVSVIM